MNGAEGRCEPAINNVFGNSVLSNKERGEILISDRCRHQCRTKRTEPEGRRIASTHRPGTQRNHSPYPKHPRDAYAVDQTFPQWRKCDSSIYSRVNLANALMASRTITSLRHVRSNVPSRVYDETPVMRGSRDGLPIINQKAIRGPDTAFRRTGRVSKCPKSYRFICRTGRPPVSPSRCCFCLDAPS